MPRYFKKSVKGMLRDLPKELQKGAPFKVHHESSPNYNSWQLLFVHKGEVSIWTTDSWKITPYNINIDLHISWIEPHEMDLVMSNRFKLFQMLENRLWREINLLFDKDIRHYEYKCIYQKTSCDVIRLVVSPIQPQ